MSAILRLTNPNNTSLDINRFYNMETGIIDTRGANFDSSPGLLSCCSLFSSLFGAIKIMISSFKIRDKEGFTEALVRVLNLPLGIASSLNRLFTFITALALGISAATLSLSTAVTGFVFLAVEFALELYRLIRTLIFSSTYEIKKINALFAANDPKAAELADEVLTRIYNDHFNLEENRQIIMINKLSRIIRPFALIDLHSKILLRETDSELDKSKIFKSLNTQINKTLIIHTIGIAAILLATAALTFAFLAFPPLTIISIGLIGFAIEFTRYFATPAFLDQSGYRWSFTACLPRCLVQTLVSRH